MRIHEFASGVSLSLAFLVSGIVAVRTARRKGATFDRILAALVAFLCAANFVFSSIRVVSLVDRI